MFRFLLIALFIIAGIWLLFSPLFSFLFGFFEPVFSPLDVGSRIVGGLVLLFFAWALVK